MTIKKCTLALVALMMSLVLFTACGGIGGSNPIVGKWKASELTVAGLTVSLDEFAETFGMEFSITFDFKADGSVSADVNGEKADGTYVLNGSQLDITIDGATMPLKYENNQLEFEIEGITATLVKQ